VDLLFRTISQAFHRSTKRKSEEKTNVSFPGKHLDHDLSFQGEQNCPLTFRTFQLAEWQSKPKEKV